MNDVSRILTAINQGDTRGAAELLPLVYDELRKLASHRLAQESPGQTLQATALVHEAYVRLVDSSHAQEWQSRGHFFAAAAEAMRRILIDQARRKRSGKHGGDWQRHELLETELAVASTADSLLAVDEVLSRLAKDHPEMARLVELRVFAGCTLQEAAECLGLSERSAFRSWAFARAWLRRELDRTDGGDAAV